MPSRPTSSPLYRRRPSSPSCSRTFARKPAKRVKSSGPLDESIDPRAGDFEVVVVGNGILDIKHRRELTADPCAVRNANTTWPVDVETDEKTSWIARQLEGADPVAEALNGWAEDLSEAAVKGGIHGVPARKKRSGLWPLPADEFSLLEHDL